MLACSLPAWEGTRALFWAGCICHGRHHAILEGLLTPVGGDGRVWSIPEGRVLWAPQNSRSLTFSSSFTVPVCVIHWSLQVWPFLLIFLQLGWIGNAHADEMHDIKVYWDALVMHLCFVIQFMCCLRFVVSSQCTILHHFCSLSLAPTFCGWRVN